MEGLLESSHYRVYDLLTVAQDGYASLVNIPVFPLTFIEQLPTNCPECGEETVITKTLSILSCSASNCSGSAAQRLVALIKDIGVLGMGLSKSKAFFEYYGLTNPYAIFAFEPVDQYGNPSPDGADVLAPNISHKVSMEIYNQVDRKRNMTLAEYVKIGNLQGVRDSAYSLFDAYDNLETFYQDFEQQGGVAFIQKKLGISADRVSVKAYQVANVLTKHKQELMDFIEYVNIKPLMTVDEQGNTKEVQKINLCMSTSVGAPYKSKADFIAQMKDLYDDKVTLTVLGGVTGSCDILVWSKSGAETSKVRKARSMNEKGREEYYNQVMLLLPYHRQVTTLEELAPEIKQLTDDYNITTVLKDESDVRQLANTYERVKIMTGAEFNTYLSQI